MPVPPSPSNCFLLRPLLVFGFLVPGLAGPLPAGGGEAAAGWSALSINSPREALAAFQASGSLREGRLGAALASAQMPPVTPDSMARAGRELEELAAGTDETARAARYCLGRLIQLSPFTPDPAAAARHFHLLVNTGADDEWCRLALLKLALIQLVVLTRPADLPAGLAQTEALFTKTTHPATRRDLHLILAEVRLYHGRRDAATLAHLRAAAAIGGLDDSMHGDLLIQQARLSTELGEVEAARGFYGEFLRLYPKDSRHFTVQGALAALPGQL